MNIIKFIKEKIFHYKENFKIKIKTSIFSNDYYYIAFSNNNGWTWDYIIESEPCYIEPYTTYNVTTKYFDAENVELFIKHNINGYESCVKYNDKVLKEIEKNNKANKMAYIERTERAKRFIEKYNKIRH